MSWQICASCNYWHHWLQLLVPKMYAYHGMVYILWHYIIRIFFNYFIQWCNTMYSSFKLPMLKTVSTLVQQPCPWWPIFYMPMARAPVWFTMLNHPFLVRWPFNHGCHSPVQAPTHELVADMVIGSILPSSSANTHHARLMVAFHAGIKQTMNYFC